MPKLVPYILSLFFIWPSLVAFWLLAFLTTISSFFVLFARLIAAVSNVAIAVIHASLFTPTSRRSSKPPGGGNVPLELKKHTVSARPVNIRRVTPDRTANNSGVPQHTRHHSRRQSEEPPRPRITKPQLRPSSHHHHLHSHHHNNHGHAKTQRHHNRTLSVEDLNITPVVARRMNFAALVSSRRQGEQKDYFNGDGHQSHSAMYQDAREEGVETR